MVLKGTIRKNNKFFFFFVVGVAFFGLLNSVSITKAEELRIFANLNLSGVDGNIGVEIKNGIELAKEQLDGQGGLVVDGAKYDLQVVYVDHKGNLTKAGQQTLQQIMKNKAVAVLPSFNEEEVVQDALIANGLKTPLVATWISEPKVIRDRPYSFKVIGDYDSEAIAMTKFAKKTFQAEKIAILYNAKDAYSTYAAQAIENSFTKSYGANSVHSLSFATQGEIKEKIGELVSSDAQFLYLPLSEYETPVAVQEAKILGWNKPITGTSYWLGENFLQKCSEMCEGTYITGWFSSKNGSNSMKRFTEEYASHYHSTPSEAAACGYDAFNVVVKGLQKLRGIDTENVTDIRKKLQKSIAGIRYDGVTGLTEYHENGEPLTKCITVSEYTGGEFTFAENVCR